MKHDQYWPSELSWEANLGRLFTLDRLFTLGSYNLKLGLAQFCWQNVVEKTTLDRYNLGRGIPG